MRRLLLLASAAVLLVAAAPAHAATQSCTRGGAKVIITQDGISVVSVTPKATKTSVPKDRVYGCTVSTGRRFELMKAYLSSEEQSWSIVGGRYIGVYANVEEGVVGQAYALTWDARKRVALYNTGPCNGVSQDPDEDESRPGPISVVYFAGGGMAYTCGGNLSHIVDKQGDRRLEPDGTAVSDLAVTPGGHTLYYSAAGTVKSLGV